MTDTNSAAAPAAEPAAAPDSAAAPAAPAAAPEAAAAPAGSSALASALGESDAAGDWRAGLSEGLRENKSLERFKSVEDLANGFVETQKMARAKSPVGADAKIDDLSAFHASRPEKPEDYNVNVPDGFPTALADGMRQMFHEAGIHPAQATKLVDGYNSIIDGLIDSDARRGASEVDAWLAENQSQGGGAPQEVKDRINSMLTTLMPEQAARLAAVKGLESAFGSKDSVMLLAKLSLPYGEPRLPDGMPAEMAADIRNMSVEQATARHEERMKNPDWVKAAFKPGTNENKEHLALISAKERAVAAQSGYARVAR